jgi:precorrin-6A/cobalt-precorrin-6A reductase
VVYSYSGIAKGVDSITFPRASSSYSRLRILLIGGTAETARTAQLLADAGFKVLVSTATDIDLSLTESEDIVRRCGRLDSDGLRLLVSSEQVEAIVDVSHPYAYEISKNVAAAAKSLEIPYFCYTRPSGIAVDEDVIWAEDHHQAAEAACSFGKPVLLTIGSKNVAQYAKEAVSKGLTLVARVLDHPLSIDACKNDGILEEFIIAARGPFSTADNLSLINKFKIGVIVTKDGGTEGGMREKLEAARLTGAKVIVVSRPAKATENSFTSIEGLVQSLARVLGHL